jgi:replicative DNA helicase
VIQKTTIDLERALLGAVMVVGLLPKTPPTPEEFSVDSHRATWIAILGVSARNEPPTLLPVSWELAKTGQFEKAGGPVYLASHLDLPDCSALAAYARMVKEAARMRKVKQMGA